jgi:uncharacterized protein
MPSIAQILKPYAAVVLTGGSSGIGKSFMGLLKEYAPEVIIFNLSRTEPSHPVGQLKVRHVPCDLTDSRQLGAALQEVIRGLNLHAGTGHLLLINNSGFGTVGPFAEADPAREAAMIDLNARAVVTLTAGLLPELRRRGGAILSIASTAAFQPLPGMATYAATKAFVLAWSVALNEELRGSGVRALAVCPGPSPTGFFASAGVSAQGSARHLALAPDAVAADALRALGSAAPIRVVGVLNRIGTWLTRLVPRRWAAALGGRVVTSSFRPSP